MLHLNQGDSLTAVMSGAATTTNPTVVVTYLDPERKQAASSLSGVTTVTLLSADADGREVEAVNVYNGDTAAVTVTLSLSLAGTASILRKTTLQAGDVLTMNTSGEWSVTDTSGNEKATTVTTVRTGYTTQVGTRAKVGGTAGWVVAAGTDLPYVATMAASQTAGTLVVPIDGLHIGDTITGFKIQAQIESAGGAVTLDADLRAVTNVAAEPTDASIGAITQVAVTADTASAASKTGLTEVVTSGKSYYLLFTGTTAAATDIILQHSEITVTTA